MLIPGEVMFTFSGSGFGLIKTRNNLNRLLFEKKLSNSNFKFGIADMKFNSHKARKVLSFTKFKELLGITLCNLELLATLWQSHLIQC